MSVRLCLAPIPMDLAKNLLSLYPDLNLLFMYGYKADAIANHSVLGEGANFIQKISSKQGLPIRACEAAD